MTQFNEEKEQNNEEEAETMEDILERNGLGDSTNTSEGGDAHEDDGQEPPKEHIPRSEYETLETQNAQLQHRLNILAQNMMSPEYVQFLENKRGQTSQPQAQVQEAPPSQGTQREEEIDFDTASQKDLVEYIEGKISQIVDSRVGEVDSKLQKQEHETKVTQYKDQIGKLSKQYPDFWGYQNEMMQVAKQYPNLGPEEVYHLAKGKSPKSKTTGKEQHSSISSSSGAEQKKGSSQTRKKAPSVERPSSSAPMKAKENLNIDEALEEAMKNLDL